MKRSKMLHLICEKLEKPPDHYDDAIKNQMLADEILRACEQARMAPPCCNQEHMFAKCSYCAECRYYWDDET